MHTGNRIIGIASAVASSATFGLAPFFTLGLLAAGLSPFEVLSYRWGIAALFLIAAGLATGRSFRLSGRDFGVVACLGLLRAATSFCLVTAYANIASGAASTIHFMSSANGVRSGPSRPSPSRSRARRFSRQEAAERAPATRRSEPPRPVCRY